VENHASDLVASGLDELNVSLDGARDLHDQIRGMPGLFEKIMAGLELIKGLKTLDKKNKPLVNIQCTITRYNYHRLEEMMAVVERAGADAITFHNLIFTNKDILEKQKVFDDMLGCSSDAWQGFSYDPGIDTALLREKMEVIRSLRHPFSIDFYPNFSYPALERYYKDPCFVPSEYPARCLSPWLVAYIFPDGSVRPCLNCSYSFGTIKEGPFAGIWNSPKALIYRQTLRKNKTFPVCARCTELYRY
jgi:Fe-coproporphyrin III synthase